MIIKPILRLLVTICSLVIFFGLPGCTSEEPAGPGSDDGASYDGIIVAMGDSLTAGLGVSPQKSYPALLEQLLRERGLNYRVVNGGVSGETSSGARSRVDWIISMKPDLVILETGANDGLRGLAPELVRSNIGEIIEKMRQADISVILAGMQMVANMGPDYVTSFNLIYPELAAEHGVSFMPFFLEGVALQPELNQDDGIHPNEQGYRIIAGNVLPYVLEVLGGP